MSRSLHDCNFFLIFLTLLPRLVTTHFFVSITFSLFPHAFGFCFGLCRSVCHSRVSHSIFFLVVILFRPPPPFTLHSGTAFHLHPASDLDNIPPSDANVSLLSRDAARQRAAATRREQVCFFVILFFLPILLASFCLNSFSYLFRMFFLFSLFHSLSTILLVSTPNPNHSRLA